MQPGERINSATDDSTVVQVAANAEAQAAATSKAYPTPSEVSLAQDILALASSALSSSTNKADDKSTSMEEQVTKVEPADEYSSSDMDGKPSWAMLLADFQKIGNENVYNLICMLSPVHIANCCVSITEAFVFIRA